MKYLKKSQRAIAIGSAIVASALTAPAIAANTATLSFEGQAYAIYDSAIVRNGYRIGVVANDERYFYELDSTKFGLTSNRTGIFFVDRFSRAYIESADKSAFRLGNFDSAWYGGSGSITVTGFLGGASVGTFTVGASSAGWTTQSGAALGAVDYVVFDGRTAFSGNGQQLDNINLAPVPEPETYAMLLAGLGLMGAVVRRHKRKLVSA